MALKPIHLTEMTPQALGVEVYLQACQTAHLPPSSAGYGLLMGVEDGGRCVTLVTSDVAYIRWLRTLPSFNGLMLPEGKFPLRHDGWIDIPGVSLTDPT